MPSLTNNELNIIVKATDSASPVLKDVGKSVEGASKSVDEAAKRSEKVSATFTKVGIAVAGVGVGITAYAKSANDYAVGLAADTKRLSRETGLASEEASRLLYVTKRLGIDADQTSTSFGIFSKQIAGNKDATQKWDQASREAQSQLVANRIRIEEYTRQIKENGDKSGELANKINALNIENKKLHETIEGSSGAFMTLGIQTEDAEGKTRSFNDILKDTADKFKDMPNGPEKTATALELFGKSGKDMIKVLDLGSEGIQELEENADKLGLTLSSKTLDSVSKYVKAQKDLTDSSNALKVQVGVLTAPVLARFYEKINDVTTSLLNSNGAIKQATVYTLAFGGPVLTTAGSLIGFGANLATVTEGVRNLGPAMATTAAFMVGPWGLGIGITAGVVAGLTYLYATQRTALDDLKRAQQETAAGLDTLKQSQQTAADANLRLEGSNIRVRDAQYGYNEAVKQYGPESEQAKDANYRLRDAINDKTKAEQDASKALADMKKAEQDYAKDRSFEEAMARKADAVRGFQGGKNFVDNLSSPAKPSTTKGGTQVTGGTSWVNQIMNSFSGWATGGYTGRGPDNEVAGLVHKGEYVLPQSQVDQSTGLPKMQSSGVTVNATYNVYNGTDVSSAAYDLGWRLSLG